MVWRASSMDGWGGMYWGAGKGRPGYRPSSVEDGVCTSAGRSGSDYSQGKSRARKNQTRASWRSKMELSLGPEGNVTVFIGMKKKAYHKNF